MSNADECSILAVALTQKNIPVTGDVKAVAQRAAFFAARQASEQYKTDSQFLAHALRHVMVRLQTAQGLLGRDCLLPLKSFFMGVVSRTDRLVKMFLSTFWPRAWP